MSEPTAPTKKKLPFKPTALRKGLAKPTPTARSITEDEAPPVTLALSDDDDDDSLALFRRAKEMAPIVKADHERRMRRQRQKQQEQEEEEERKRAFASNEYSLHKTEDVVMSASTPSSHKAGIMATQEGEDSRRDLVTPPPSKRSRLSTSASSTRNRDADVDQISDSMPESPTLRAMRSLAPDRSITPAAFNTSPQYTSTSASGYSTRSQARVGGAPFSASSQVITLDSDSETEEAGRAAPAATGAIAARPRKGIDEAALLPADLTSHALLDNTPEDDDDDEFSEYVRKAREQRDRLLQTRHNQGPFSAASVTPGPFDESPTAAALLPPSSSGIQSNVPSAAAAAVVVTSPSPTTSQQQQTQSIDILVSSEIPNTKPLLFKFRFDSPMRIVRDNWTASQYRHSINLRGPGLLERDEDVVLTWRKQKVYMYSTLLSLGIRPSEDGDGSAIVVEEEEGGGRGGDGRHLYARDGFNEAATRVLMQAWTPAMFERMTREEELQRRRDAGEFSDDDDDGVGGGGYGGTQGTATTSTMAGSDGEQQQRQQQEAAKMRVILKSRDMEPVKLKVIAETTTETLVAAFRAQRPVAEGATIGLWFDGMQLEEGATMMDADIDDMDTIEVHVK